MVILGNGDEFEFNVRGDERKYKGILRELTNKEQKELKKRNTKIQNDLNVLADLEEKLKRLKKLIDLAEAKGDTDEAYEYAKKHDRLSEEYEQKVKDFDSLDIIEIYAKQHLQICLSGDDKDDILSLGEKYGYSKVTEVILKSIEEKKPKPSKGRKNG